MSFKQSEYNRLRKNMVEDQLVKRGISDKRILEAMMSVPRELFIPDEYKKQSYYDGPIPIGYSQTISQPYIVAFMTESLKLKKNDKVLEIGTGCGYQTAILAEIGCDVFTIEIIRELGESAKVTLDQLGYTNIKYKIGNGLEGWKEYSPYNGILAAATASEIPDTLVSQLQTGGRMIIPVENKPEMLKLITKNNEGIKIRSLLPVKFVKMIQ